MEFFVGRAVSPILERARSTVRIREQENGWPYLSFPQIHMIHINKGNSISILMVIDSNTNLFEDELNIELRRLTINFVIHNNLNCRSESMQYFIEKALYPAFT